jgi:hypothetical protein
MADELLTIQTGYRILRDTVSSADTDLAAATKKWSTFVSTYHPESGSAKTAYRVLPRHNRATIIFDHKNVDADTATFVIYAYREGGPAEKVCTSTLQSGKQQNNDATTRFYADTIGTVTSTWPATVSESDSAGGDGVAKITFDMRGYKYLLCLFTVISANDDVRAKIAFH